MSREENDPNPNLAVVLGAPKEDPITEIVAAYCQRRFFYYAKSVRKASELIQLLKREPDLGKRRSLVVLCSGSARYSLTQSIRRIKKQRPKAARIVIYATGLEEDGRFALDCIQAGACDYLVPGSYDVNQLQERLTLALESDTEYSPYPPFENLRSVRRLSVFVVTPFAALAADDYRSGIMVALKRLKIPYQRADDERLFTFLLSGICRQIDNHTVVICNISPFGRAPNPNVFLETGYAVATKKAVILAQRASNRKVPSDLQGLERLEYVNCADLTLKLYFGLRALSPLARWRRP